MEKADNKKRETLAALDALLGLNQSELSPGAQAEFVRLGNLKDKRRLSPEKSTEAWEVILRRRAENIPGSAAGESGKTRAGSFRRLLPHLVFAASFLAFVFSLGFIYLHTPLESPLDLSASAHKLQGRVLLNGKEIAGTARPVYGDLLELGPGAKLDLIVDQKNIFRLYPESRLRYLVRPGSGLLRLERGGIAAVVKNKKKVGSFRIEAPSVAVLIRGTSLVMETAEPRKVFFCICNGRVRVKPFGRETLEMASAHHRHRVFQGEVDPEYYRYAAAGEKNSVDEFRVKRYLRGHSDASLEELAAKIGESINWRKIPGAGR